MHREGRVLTVLTRDREAVDREARAIVAGVDRLCSPVTLKEIFLESVKTED